MTDVRELVAQISSTEDAKAALAKISLKHYIEFIWPVVVPGDPFQDNFHVDALVEHLEALKAGQIDDLLINIPPRFAKSTIANVIFPSWIWLDDPATRFVTAAFKLENSIRDNVAMRMAIQSNLYQKHWGHLYQLADDQNMKMRYDNDKRGFRIASAIGGQTGEGGDYTIVDDPHDVKEANSEVALDTVRRWWTEVMPSRTGRGGRTKRIVIMQRVSEKDLAAEILKSDNWCHLNLPMEFETKFAKPTRGVGWEDPRTKEGELIWPQRFPREYIDRVLSPPAFSSVSYAAQYQQRPAPMEGGMFKRGWWKYYEVLPDIEKMDDSCWSWDMAFKDLDTSDYVCGTGWVRKGADFYLMPHRVHEQIGFSASKQAVKNCDGKMRMKRVLIEDKANGTAIIEDLKHTVGRVIAVEPKGGKEARASVMQPYAEAGNIYLPAPRLAPWVEDYVEEFRVFPNGAHDDYVDSSSQAICDMLDRWKRSFDPFTWSHTKSTARSHGEKYRDPRYGDEQIETPAKSMRGDELRANARPPTQHDLHDSKHRAECRGCRNAWKKTA